MKEIVCNKGVTTYKEVAEILLNVINSQERARFQSEGEMVILYYFTKKNYCFKYRISLFKISKEEPMTL